MTLFGKFRYPLLFTHSRHSWSASLDLHHGPVAILAKISSFALSLSSQICGPRLNFVTHNIDQDVKAVSAEPQHPRVLYHHAAELQELQVYEPMGQEGGRAMAVKVSLDTDVFSPRY